MITGLSSEITSSSVMTNKQILSHRRPDFWAIFKDSSYAVTKITNIKSPTYRLLDHPGDIS